jgi:carbon storage regulator
LVIGGNITVVISRVAGNRVTIGIEAPDDVRIVRGELKPEREALAGVGSAVSKASVHQERHTVEGPVARLAK